jgi:hypothetical protein
MNRFPPTLWCSFYLEDKVRKYRTNNYIEPQFKQIKTHLKKSNLSIDILITEIYEYSIFVEKKKIITTERTHKLDDILLRLRKKSMISYLLLIFYPN